MTSFKRYLKEALHLNDKLLREAIYFEPNSEYFEMPSGYNNPSGISGRNSGQGYPIEMDGGVFYYGPPGSPNERWEHTSPVNGGYPPVYTTYPDGTVVLPDGTVIPPGTSFEFYDFHGVDSMNGGYSIIKNGYFIQYNADGTIHMMYPVNESGEIQWSLPQSPSPGVDPAADPSPPPRNPPSQIIPATNYPNIPKP